LAHDEAGHHGRRAPAVGAVDALGRTEVGLELALRVERVLDRLHALIGLQLLLELERHAQLLVHGPREALVHQVVPTQRLAASQGRLAIGLERRVVYRLIERPGQGLLAQVLRRRVADPAAVDDSQTHAPTLRDRGLVRLAVPRVDPQLPLRVAEDLCVHAAVRRLLEEPALRLFERHASPPTTISLTRMWGCPTSVGMEPDFEPHMPGSLL